MSAGPKTITRRPSSSSADILLQNVQEESSCVATGRSFRSSHHQSEQIATEATHAKPTLAARASDIATASRAPLTEVLNPGVGVSTRLESQVPGLTLEEHFSDTPTTHERYARRSFTTTAQTSHSELQAAWTDDNMYSTELVELSPKSRHDTESSILSGGLTNVPLISIDKSLLSRNICIGCLVFSWLWSVACISFGSQELPTKLHPSVNGYNIFLDIQSRAMHGYRLSSSLLAISWGARLMTFALNILVTLCTDSLGFIQTASLRWSLHREGRLDFNSNLRLLTATKDSLAHRWYINALSALFVSVCYAATPLLSAWRAKTDPPYSLDDGYAFWIPKGIHFLYLGLALMGQATLATWCLLTNLRSIPTWSSNPLNTTLACLSINLQRRDGRCMMSVHNAHYPAMTKFPQKQQADASEASQRAARITRWLWGIVLITFLGGIATVLSVELVIPPHVAAFIFPTRPYAVLSMGFSHLWRGHGLMFVFPPPVFPRMGINATNTLKLLFMMLVQGLLVFGLHCLEILVNMSRDEDVWRLAISDKGVRHEYNAIIAALRSPQTLMLFGGKAAAHWAIGQSVHINDGAVTIRTVPIFVLTAILAGLTCFGRHLATRKPKGSLPATYGHIQTLADLIDKWSDTMFWGDKGVVPGTELRHAGTSSRPLKPARSGSRYGGACCDAVCDAYNRL